MKEALEIVASIIAIFGVLGACLGWWISKFLTDKKDDVTNALRITHLESEQKSIREDMKDLETRFDKYKDRHP